MGRGCAHIRWWGRKFCNFSVVLETSEEQAAAAAAADDPSWKPELGHHSDLVRV